MADRSGYTAFVMKAGSQLDFMCRVMDLYTAGVMHPVKSQTTSQVLQ